MERVQWVMAAAVVAVAGLAGWWFGGAPQTPPPLVVESPTSAGELTVHVAGEVAQPGLVNVPGGRRVADAIAAAGGLLPSADGASLNLAAPLLDGQQIVVRRRGTSAANQDDDRVHLNSASVADLERIPGVGPVLAARIMTFREANGPFVAVEDLLEVAGIGEAKLAALRDVVVVP